jgi:hypothetical protein
MAVVLPVMLSALTLYNLAGVLVGLLLGLIFPPFAFIVTFLIMASSSVVPTLIGTRMGLQVKGMKPSIKIKGLFTPAVIYGAVEGVSVTLIVGVIVAASIFVISPDILQQSEVADLALEYVDPSWALPGLLVMLAVFLSVCSIRASLLVPITSASIGRDPDGMHYTPFRHFRAAFGPLFALTIFSYVGMFVLHILLIALLIAMDYFGTLQADLQELEYMTQGTASIRPLWSLIGLSVVYMLIGIWAFSLQCAGGVLGYLRLRDTAPKLSEVIEANLKPAQGAEDAPRMSAEDLRAMRKSRQAGNF